MIWARITGIPKIAAQDFYKRDWEQGFIFSTNSALQGRKAEFLKCGFDHFEKYPAEITFCRYCNQISQSFIKFNMSSKKTFFYLHIAFFLSPSSVYHLYFLAVRISVKVCLSHKEAYKEAWELGLPVGIRIKN